MHRVILESPYRGNVTRMRDEAHVAYGRRCLRDCLMRFESAIASHLLLTQEGVLDDAVESERELGIEAGHIWMHVADYVVVYVDRGISPGMEKGIERAREQELIVKFRSLVHFDVAEPMARRIAMEFTAREEG